MPDVAPLPAQLPLHSCFPHTLCPPDTAELDVRIADRFNPTTPCGIYLVPNSRGQHANGTNGDQAGQSSPGYRRHLEKERENGKGKVTPINCTIEGSSDRRGQWPDKRDAIRSPRSVARWTEQRQEAEFVGMRARWTRFPDMAETVWMQSLSARPSSGQAGAWLRACSQPDRSGACGT